jgi:hypothetical protein
MIKKYIIALLIQLVSLGVGFGLSYLVDLTKLFKMYDAHDLGLQNLFMMVIIFGIIGALTNIYLYHSLKPILIFSTLLIVALVVLLFRWVL